MSKIKDAIAELETVDTSSNAVSGIIGRAVAALQLAHNTLEKVSAIRDSIVGCQGFNFSEHAYPLVAVLKEAGFEGAGYEISRANLGTLMQRLETAEAIARTWHAACDQRSPEWYADAEAIRRFDE